MRRHHLTLMMLVTLALLSPLIATARPAHATQVQNQLELVVWPRYLGPQVVLSGSVGSAAGIPTVTVVVEDATGAVVFDGIATAALRPPLGLPAASWRVPLTLPDGEYQVTAVSTLDADTLDSSTGSFLVVSELTPPLEIVAPDADWAFYDRGDEPPTMAGATPVEWYEADYDASAWPTGPAELGYGDGGEATVTAETGIFGQTIVAQYFRHEFTPADLSSYDSLTLSLLRDDGAVVYLNGVELGRTNMPDGPIAYGTPASSVSEQTITIALTPAELVVGSNLLAVEVHQSSATSSDLSFSLSLRATESNGPRASDNTEGVYLLAAGDMARCNFDGDEAVAAQMADLFDTDRGLFIGLGDLVYQSGTIDEFTNCYDPTIGQFRDVTWPSPGNHEHFTAPNAAGYRQYFGPAAGPSAGPNGGLWYSFDVDDHWHIIALDSDCRGREVLPGARNGNGCAVGSEQEAWLRADLEANQDKNILAFFHHPPFTNNQYLDHEFTWPLWRALAEYGAEITLHGHEHHYERYQPLDYWGDPLANATTEFIIGSGGTTPRYDVRPQEGASAFRGTFPAGTNDFGVLQLWLRPDGYEWKWESIYGLAASDSGSAGLTNPMQMAAITGLVTSLEGGAALAGIEVCAEASRTGLDHCTTTNGDGTYELGPFVLDLYQVTFLDPADNFVADPVAGYAVDLIAPQTATVDSALLPRPSITGDLVAEFSGVPVANATVCAVNTEDAGSSPRCANSIADGSYVIDGLDPQRGHRVSFEATGFVSECFDNVRGACDATATVVNVGTTDITDIDAVLELSPAGIIGQVTRSDTGASLAAIEVCADSILLPAPACASTTGTGNYTIDGLKTGNYTISYTDPAEVFLPECYRDRPCENPVLVGVIQPAFRTEIDAALDPVPPGGPGDPDCDYAVASNDTQVILEFGVGTRVDASGCPLEVGELFVGAGDINADGDTDLLDALLIAQCAVGVAHEWCPDP